MSKTTVKIITWAEITKISWARRTQRTRRVWFSSCSESTQSLIVSSLELTRNRIRITPLALSQSRERSDLPKEPDSKAEHAKHTEHCVCESSTRANTSEFVLHWCDEQLKTKQGHFSKNKQDIECEFCQGWMSHSVEFDISVTITIHSDHESIWFMILTLRFDFSETFEPNLNKGRKMTTETNPFFLNQKQCAFWSV